MSNDVTVISIGLFENGSFGVFGLPIGGAELFRLDCPELREMVAKAAPALADYSRFTFASRASAEAAVPAQIARETMIATERKKATDAAVAIGAAKKTATENRIIDMVKSVAEEWAAGRVAVKISQNEVVVGRWNAPNIPGYGRPAEVRVARRVNGQITLIDCSPNLGFCWF